MAGLKEVPAIVEDMDDATARRLATILNIQSETLKDFEIGRGLKMQVEPLEPGQESLTIEQLCRDMSKSRKFIDNHIGLTEVRTELEPMAQVDGKMSIVLLLDAIQDEVIFQHLFPLAEKGAPLRILEILSDITDEKLREEITTKWRQNVKLEKLQDIKTKAFAKAAEDEAKKKQSKRAPDAQTERRSKANSKTGGGSMSRGLPVTTTSKREIERYSEQSADLSFGSLENSMSHLRVHLSGSGKRYLLKTAPEKINSLRAILDELEAIEYND
jgi:ParB-like chromosome segregation protein Spo0J